VRRSLAGCWIVAVLGCISALAAPPPIGRFDIPLPDGRREIAPGIDLPPAVAAPRIFVIQFRRFPNGPVRSALRTRGVHLLDRLYRTAFFARQDPGVDVRTVLTDSTIPQEIRDAVRAVFTIAPRSKIAPILLRSPSPTSLLGPHGRLRARVVFHRGTKPTEATDALRDAGIATSESVDPPTVWAVEASGQQILDLAGEESVKWIRPPPPGFLPLADMLRQSSGCDALQAWEQPLGIAAAHPPSGTSSNVAVFDCPPTTPNGRIHSDLMKEPPTGTVPGVPRVVLAAPSDRWSCGGLEHGDEVMGLIGGNGIRSEDRIYRGCAPEVGMSVYPPYPDLYGYSYVLASGATFPISNHSYITSALIYDDYAAALDRVALGQNGVASDGVHGSESQVVVVSAGNSGVVIDSQVACVGCADNDGGNCANCDTFSTCGNARGYFSVFGTAKNAITVGASYAGPEAAMAGTRAAKSSMGPTPDGRLKPDVIAPGCRPDNGTGSPKLLETVDAAHDTYASDEECATSFATAVVTGAVALLFDVWKSVRTEDDRDRLWPSTYKAALVHGALDMTSGAPAIPCEVASNDCVEDLSEAPSCIDPSSTSESKRYSAGYERGPDYATGFGHVRALESARAILERRFEESVVSDAHAGWSGEIDVPSGASNLRVALAWDDPEASPGPHELLIHDLDVSVIAPTASGGKRYGPWVPPFVPWLPSGSPSFDCPLDYCGIDTLSLDYTGYAGIGIPPAIRCVLSGDTWSDVDTGRRLLKTDGTVISKPYGAEIAPEDDDTTAALEDLCMDRHNNVELVEIDAPDPPGTWTVQVEAARIGENEQQEFSVVWGYDLPPSDSVLATLACADVELGGGGFDGSTLSVDDLGACFKLRFEDLCDVAPTGGFCGARCTHGPCTRFTMSLDGWPPEIRVAVLDEGGETLVEEHRGMDTGRWVEFVPEPDRSYRLVGFVEDPQDYSEETKKNGVRLVAGRDSGRD